MEESKENTTIQSFANPDLTSEGLKCKDENGNDIFIPRCQEQDKYCYKYTEEQYQYRQYLLKECSQSYPDMDKGIVEIMVDFYLNHPDKFVEKDKQAMKHIIDK